MPEIQPNRSVPGVTKLTELAGGLSTLVVVGAAIGFLLGLGLMAVAGSAQNVHLRERAKSGTGWALTVAVLAAGANRLLDWAGASARVSDVHPPSTRRDCCLLVDALLAPETASANPIDWAGGEIGGVIRGSPAMVSARYSVGCRWRGVARMRCFDAMSQTTDPRVSSAWFAESYARMTLIAVGLSAPCFLLGLLQALIHRDGAILGRVVPALPLSALLTGGAVGVTQLLLGATDEASRWLVAASGHDLTGFGTTFAKAFVVAPGASLFVVFLVSLFAAVCALVLWIELLIRAALVYVLLGFFPLVASAMVWPAAAAGVRRVVRLSSRSSSASWSPSVSSAWALPPSARTDRQRASFRASWWVAG